ncbi:MAG: thiamine pyrophosphate-binding protein [Pseudomonadota bacterium]
MNGAEYIVEFLRQRGSDKFFLLTGGACAFIIDAVGRNPGTTYTCFQHEQSAAMAVDSLYRIDGRLGVTVATSGPGATNLITGIASSYFDSIPAIHITGQVNKLESKGLENCSARQLGFQETNIVDMVKPVTKYAVQVNSAKELKEELSKAYNIAISGRKGPVLIDVPMNIQNEEMGEEIFYEVPEKLALNDNQNNEIAQKINDFLKDGERPLVVWGAGIGLSGSEQSIENFLEENNLPFVSSWAGMTYFDNTSDNYIGHIGVYGNRGANFAIQNCDRLLVLGSRLDNRQRGGNPNNFAITAETLAIDVDQGELDKYRNKYETICMDLSDFSSISSNIKIPKISADWLSYLKDLKNQYFNRDLSEFHKKENSLSPYKIVQSLQSCIQEDAIVIGDTGAALCWMYQAFIRTKQLIFTSGGNSPMGYSLPASIGAAIHAPQRQIISLNGDGGFQLNLQELQTIKQYDLDIKIFIFNNYGYGIIKQFQDSYCESRYDATGKGYSCPDFKNIANAYDLEYHEIKSVDDMKQSIFDEKVATIIDVKLHPNTLIEPKLEMGRPIHDQFPYLDDAEFETNSRFCENTRKINS